MDKEELKTAFYEFAEQYGRLGLEKIFVKLERIHRGNLENIIKEWTSECDRMEHPVIKK